MEKTFGVQIKIIGEVKYEPKKSLFLEGAKKGYLTAEDVVKYMIIKNAMKK